MGSDMYQNPPQKRWAEQYAETMPDALDAASVAFQRGAIEVAIVRPSRPGGWWTVRSFRGEWT